MTLNLSSFVVVSVSGITCIDNKLFAVFYNSHTIGVFAADTLSEVSFITVDGLQEPRDLVACCDDHQLYVLEKKCSIWRVSAVNPTDYERWLTDFSGGNCTLSLTSRRLLVTVTSGLWRRLHQYSTTNKQLLRIITVDGRFTHAVETSRGTFVIGRVATRDVSELL